MTTDRRGRTSILRFALNFRWELHPLASLYRHEAFTNSLPIRHALANVFAMWRKIVWVGVTLSIQGCATGAQIGDSTAISSDAGALASDAGAIDSGSPIIDAGAATTPDAGTDAGIAVSDTLSSNRDRLLGTYFDFLKTFATVPQSNGLSSSNVTNVCDVWTKLDPSSQQVFLTLTARFQGSLLGSDGSSMLSHVTKLYRISGGQNATTTDPGSCGGGEFNRMIMQMDAALYAAQIAANSHQGAVQASGKFDIADAPGGTFWRNSQDLGGPHTPFDISDETSQGAPRGQTQYFSDPTSTAASSPLGREDLTTLVDPYALEFDQDYDCPHNSNPACAYTSYGPACFLESSQLGTQIFIATYGIFDATWKPAACP